MFVQVQNFTHIFMFFSSRTTPLTYNLRASIVKLSFPLLFEFSLLLISSLLFSNYMNCIDIRVM
jgi:hypothetical protein